MRRLDKYIHELPHWPDFHWNEARISRLLGEVRHLQGRLLGRMEAIGFSLRSEATLQTLTEDVLKSSEIEGEHLDRKQVRSSVARHLGIETLGLPAVDRNVEGVVEMMLDATQNYALKLTRERLFAWHASLFPSGRSGLDKIVVGSWRDDSSGPMQVVSGQYAKEVIHFEAPDAGRLEEEMCQFLTWFETNQTIDPVVKSAVAHLWFLTIHPFADGNGRIARAISDLLLARSESSPQRFYSMSAQIRIQRNAYYEILESTQKGKLDITSWIEWFLTCLRSAITAADQTLSQVLYKARFWESLRGENLNNRQREVIMRLLEGFEGKLTTTKWARLTKSSQDTALRDISDLLERRILIRNPGGGRSTSYSLANR